MNIVQSLFEKYEDDEYMMGRLNAIIKGMPEQMQSIERGRAERVHRQEVNTKLFSDFADDFLADQAYLYIPSD